VSARGPLSRRRILIVIADAVGAKMAGPAIRAWAMAGLLAAEHDVVLATLGACTRSSTGFAARSVGAGQLRELAGWCEVLLVRGFVTAVHPWLLATETVVVADIYDPMQLEALEPGRDGGQAARRRSVQGAVVALNDQLLRADLLLCASDRQRDFWLGSLAALGRVNPATYDADRTLGSLLAVVPFGLSADPPVRGRGAIRGVVPGIDGTDEVIVWGGGIYNWFDPLTLLRAVDRLRHRRPQVRLYFLGVTHPNSDDPGMAMAVAARSLAAELGLLDRHVFFNTGWVDFDDRAGYLLDADLGVSTHLDTVETAYSFRTRVLDYLWAGLPVVTTAGDALADLVAAEQLGLTVPPGDTVALEAALFRLLDDSAFAADCRSRVAAVAPRFAWPEAVRPLIEFCRDPQRAPDRPSTATIGGDQLPGLLPPPDPSLAADLRLVRRYLRAGGPAELWRRARGRLARRTRERVSRGR